MAALHYVGPATPPPSRRPPTRQDGLLAWMRKNLFGSVVDSVSTVITALIFGLLLYEFLYWAMIEAQWELVFLNLRNLGVGQNFPLSEVWRIELTSHIVMGLFLLSIGFWGSLRRSVFIGLGIIAAAMVVIPTLGQLVPEPPIHYYVDAQYPIRQVNFVAEEGTEITFELDPLTSPSDFGSENLQGYIANDNQLPNTSWDRFNEVTRDVRREVIDPAQYALSLAVQVWDAQGEVIAQSPFTEGTTDTLAWDWSTPEAGWYTFTMVLEDEANVPGSVFVRVQDLEVFYSTPPETAERIERYGPEPALNCPACNTSTNRTDLRYVGERSIPQFFSLQLGPYLAFVREFFFITLAVGGVAYAIGQVGQRQLVGRRQKLASRAILALWVLGLVAVFVLSTGIPGSEALPTISTANFGGVFLTILLSVVGIGASFPVGILLALGRQSELPVIKFLCGLWIEVVRGVPLITLLFMGRYIVPFFIDGLENIDLVLRMFIVLTFFTAAYLAEVIRGGLQIIPKGQVEAARAIGLSSFHITGLVVLPQALRAVIPAMMGQFVSLLKDTSLVALIGLFELTGAMRNVLTDTQTGYAAFQREGYLYIGIVYFVLSYVLAEASRRLERTGSGAARKL
ncbi:MAG: amino acid ABC transporter permease [Anaerolineae bacterium]|nr:amino acid ABC transporter permease [Anaerolineae bacterium]